METIMGKSPDPNYVRKVMFDAIASMCGRSSAEQRLFNATIAGLERLSEGDLEEGKLRNDLQFVLKWTTENVESLDYLSIRKVPDDTEHKELVEKMLRILTETTRANRAAD
jgi:hypothetical protein